MVSNLIQNRAAQRERIEEKRSAVLSWLAGESFTSPATLEKVLGLERNATYKTIQSMVRDGLVARHTIAHHGGRLHLVALTVHGSGMCIDPSNPGQEVRYYEQGRVAASSIAHQLDVQTARLKAENAGWTRWVPDQRCRQMASDRGWLKVPDAVAIDQAGELVAVEIERTIKSRKRYEAVISEYLQMVRQGHVSRVDYVTPDAAVAPRLRAIFSSINSVLVKGERVQLSAHHHERFNFYSLKEWPKNGTSMVVDRGAGGSAGGLAVSHDV